MSMSIVVNIGSKTMLYGVFYKILPTKTEILNSTLELTMQKTFSVFRFSEQRRRRATGQLRCQRSSACPSLGQRQHRSVRRRSQQGHPIRPERG